MEDIDSSPVSPNPRKRGAPNAADDTPEKKPLNLKGTQFIMPTPPDTDRSNQTSPSASNQNPAREASPALSETSTLSSIEDVSSLAVPSSNTTGGASSGQPPAKRRKLTPSEKIERQREKEMKARERAEQKAKKDEEKAKKDEEKRVKDLEKQKKAEEREAKRREKELEEERKEQEKAKKERSQMRLGAFFQQKLTTPAKSEGLSTFVRRKSLSLEPYDAVADQIRRSASPMKGSPLAARPEPTPVVEKPVISDYHKYFLPYEPPSNSTLAVTYAIKNPDDLAYWQGMFDSELQDPAFQEKVDLGIVQATAAFDHHFTTEEAGQRGIPVPNLRGLIDRIQGTSQQPVDLTQESFGEPPIQALQNVSRRHLHFYEDVRPAYFGTYTRITCPQTTRKLSRNPFSRSRKDTDYDYDSEAEWDEPEEGDEILDEEDDEAESLGDKDEMDEFLDDEDDAVKNKRKLITGDLEASSTGLCWESSDGRFATEPESEVVLREMLDMRIGVLLPDFKGGSIDPFSTVYWQGDMAPPAVPVTTDPLARLISSAGRPPLQDRANTNGTAPSQNLIGAAAGEKGPITSTAAMQGAKRGPKPKPKTLSKEDLEEFKEAVVGSPLGRLDLQKGLKAR